MAKLSFTVQSLVTKTYAKVTHYNKKSNERDIFLCENYNFVILNQKESYALFVANNRFVAVPGNHRSADWLAVYN